MLFQTFALTALVASFANAAALSPRQSPPETVYLANCGQGTTNVQHFSRLIYYNAGHTPDPAGSTYYADSETSNLGMGGGWFHWPGSHTAVFNDKSQTLFSWSFRSDADSQLVFADVGDAKNSHGTTFRCRKDDGSMLVSSQKGGFYCNRMYWCQPKK